MYIACLEYLPAVPTAADGAGVACGAAMALQIVASLSEGAGMAPLCVKDKGEAPPAGFWICMTHLIHDQKTLLLVFFFCIFVCVCVCVC